LRPPVESKLRFSAWSVLAHTEFEQANFANAERAYTESLRFLQQEDARRDGFEELLAASIYRQGEASRDAGSYEAAVGHFLRLGKVLPDSPIRITAEYDAAAVLLETKQWQQAIVVLQDFRRNYPGHELQADTTRNLAVAYLESGQTLAAAQEFGRLGVESGNPQFKREASLQSAELYEEAGAIDQAIAAYTAYLTAYPEPFAEAIEWHQKLIDLYTKQNNAKAVAQWQRKLVDREVVGQQQRTARTRFLAAQALLELARPVMAAYQRIPLTIPLADSLNQKKARMKQALAMYTQAAGYGIQDVSTESTHHTGVIYQSLSEALLDSERPAGLSELELEQYEILLEDEAFPFEEKAIEVFEINSARIPQGIYDDWVKASLTALAEILPGRYNKQERADPFVEAVQ
ncbi:MAG: outer membrane protein assembly factor BamD, partial [Pseudomonadota bacterium]